MGATTLVAGIALAVSVGVLPGLAAAQAAPPPLWPAATVAVATLVGLLWARERELGVAGAGFALVILAWQLRGLVAWPALAPTARALLLAAPPLAVAGTALLLPAAAGDARRAHSWARTGALLAVVAVAVHVVAYDPFLDPDCGRFCRPSTLAVLPGPSARQVLAAVAVVTALAMLCTLVSLRAARPDRWAATGLALGLVLAGGVPVQRAVRWGGAGATALEDALAAGGTLLVLGTAGYVFWRLDLARRVVARLVVELTTASPHGGARPDVASPQFAMPGDGRWVDVDGREVSVPPANAVVLACDDGGTMRLPVPRGAGAGPPSMVAATRLALDNLRLTALERAKMADVQASRRRVVETADAERRRIDRDLHDGTQQRLVGVLLQLAVVPGPAARRAAGDVRAVLAVLRGSTEPGGGAGDAALLLADGLEAAVHELAWRHPLDVAVDVEPAATALSGSAALTAVLTVDAALTGVAGVAPGARVQVSVTVEDDGVAVLVVAPPGTEGSLRDVVSSMTDRVEALGGHVGTGGAARRSEVWLWLPCASS